MNIDFFALLFWGTVCTLLLLIASVDSYAMKCTFVQILGVLFPCDRCCLKIGRLAMGLWAS